MATPPVLGSTKDFRAFSKRCFEIASKRRKVCSNVNRQIPTTPTRRLPIPWGQSDGESSAELNPRAKRRRLSLLRDSYDYTSRRDNREVALPIPEQGVQLGEQTPSGYAWLPSG